MSLTDTRVAPRNVQGGVRTGSVGDTVGDVVGEGTLARSAHYALPSWQSIVRAENSHFHTRHPNPAPSHTARRIACLLWKQGMQWLSIETGYAMVIYLNRVCNGYLSKQGMGCS